jgi:hypothetical protein
MLAAVGLRSPPDDAAAALSGEPGWRAGGQAVGTTHKPDHDAFNDVLRRAFQPVINAVSGFDQLVPIMAPSWTPIDDLTSLQGVMAWREVVWREAEQLLNAKTGRQRQLVEDAIAENAALTATLIATPPFPGYRPVRDAYCRAHVL